MASTHIEIPSTASRLSASMRALIGQLRNVQELCDEIKDISDQVAFGSDWEALGTKLGVSAAEAETVYNLLGSVNTELGGTFINQFLSRCG